MINRPRAWSPEETANLLNCSRAQVFIEIREGRLKARKMGHKTLILDSEIDTYLQSLPEREPALQMAKRQTA